LFTSADGPPITIERALLEVEEEEEVEEGEEGEERSVEEGEDIDEDREAPVVPRSILENDTSDDYIKANIERIAALAAAAETKSVKMNSDLYAYGNSDRKEVDVKSVVEGVVGGGVSVVSGERGSGVVGVGGGGEEKDDVQDTFTKLLKATMDQQSLAAESTGNIIIRNLLLYGLIILLFAMTSLIVIKSKLVIILVIIFVFKFISVIFVFKLITKLFFFLILLYISLIYPSTHLLLYTFFLLTHIRID
jgi:hypothetical protein